MNLPILRRATGGLSRHDPQFARRLALFAKTVGKELVGNEIDEALEWCELYGANPFTRDIYFFVFDADKTDKRRVVPVLAIGLYRKIAARSGNYRPGEKAPVFTYDDDVKGPTNPRGIVACEVTIYRHSHGEWHPLIGRVKWEERAPLKEKWADIGNGKREPTGEFFLDPKKSNWLTMPETMLAKCAEADAIRRGWPNETSGSYVDGELDAAHTIELTATEIVNKADSERRLQMIGAPGAVIVDWMDGEPLQRVPAGQFADQALKFIGLHMKKGEEEPGAVLAWRERNRTSLAEFWALDKDAALALKKELEKVEALARVPS